ncbi:hypothetical protein KA529_02450 [Candidatus Saccharibacteria bacterium]|nr:hypothetical protein [Candidatus Saccharibacteria bacterium]
MGLMNIFRNNNSVKITPLTMNEKIFFVKVFLQTKNIIPKDFGDVEGDNLKSLAGTPQYTLVMYLDYLYMFTMNDAFRKSVKEAATGIDLNDFSLNTNSLLKLAEYYTTMRGLPESARKEIYEIWQDNVNSSDEDSFDTFKDASYWWGDKIVEPLQIFDCVENKTRENLTDDGYWDKVEHQLSLNRSLIDSYLEIRGIE